MLILLLGRAGSSGGTRKGYNRLAGEESELTNVNCTAAQETPGQGHGAGPGSPDSSDTDSNCTEEETSDDSDYGEYRKHWLLELLTLITVSRGSTGHWRS
jgi:hypothetical protein